MRKSLILAAALMMGTRHLVEAAEAEVIAASSQAQQLPMKQARERSKKATKQFHGYGSDRKGKGQKKRDASIRQKNGWR